MRGDRGVARKGIAGNGSLPRICRVVGIDVFNLFLWRMIGGEYLGEYSKMYFVIVSRKVNDKCTVARVNLYYLVCILIICSNSRFVGAVNIQKVNYSG